MKGITLIGMPGAGKSTIGRMLATKLGWKFIDLDDYILETKGKHHHEIMTTQGEQALMDLEQELTLGLDLSNLIFAPGGSIVFSGRAMEKIKKDTTMVYLRVSLEEVRKHLGDKINRNGIIGLAEKGIDGVFHERVPIYETVADLIINTEGEDDKEHKVQKVYEVLKSHHAI